jgi:hypothetical protein
MFSERKYCLTLRLFAQKSNKKGPRKTMYGPFSGSTPINFSSAVVPSSLIPDAIHQVESLYYEID